MRRQEPPRRWRRPGRIRRQLSCRASGSVLCVVTWTSSAAFLWRSRIRSAAPGRRDVVTMYSLPTAPWFADAGLIADRSGARREACLPAAPDLELGGRAQGAVEDV